MAGINLYLLKNRKTKACESEGAIEQVIGREAKTATFLKRFFLNLSLCAAGFCPRQLGRYVYR